MLKEVIAGLTSTPKTLPSKYFYDQRGSELFDEITELEEYYPTRTERAILKKYVDEIESQLGQNILLIEPGSGSSEKTKILLKRMSNIGCYMPMDISGDYLLKVAEQLQQEFPHIEIKPLSIDYTQPFKLPDDSPNARRVVFYPGSTIGNFKRDKVDQFLKVIYHLVKDGGAFLIGVDLKKDISVLEAAYNDKKGVTAAFNKNILSHINSVIHSNFDATLFEHKSIWNEDKGRIEMHLFAKESHEVQVNGTTISFEEGESVHTENSHKYTLKGFAQLVSKWFEVKKVWTDENQYFSLQYLVPK